MPFPLIVSYHTPDNVYTRAADRLRRSLEEIGLEHSISCLQSRGSWSNNVCQKTIFIKSMLNEHPGRDIVWIDADSVIVNYPSELDNIKADVACPLWDGKKIFLTTAFFSNCAKVMSFMDRWIDLTYESIKHSSPEQFSFGLALNEMPEVSFQRLPDSYAYVPKESPNTYPPVIRAELISRYVGYAVYPR